MCRTRLTRSRSPFVRDCSRRRCSRSMPDAFVVHGRSRLIVDIIRGVLADQDLPHEGRAVAVLVDPEPEHWAAVGDRAVVLVTTTTDQQTMIAAIRRGADAVVEADRVVDDLASAVV